MVIKRDPGQGIIWLAFLSLISGLVLTLLLPAPAASGRDCDDDRLSVALTGDRYVNAEREFGELLETLSARLARRPQVRLGR